MHRPLPPVRFCLYRDGISRGTGGCEDPDDGQTKPVTENASSFAWSVLVLTKIQFNETFQYFKNEISNYTYNFHTYGQSAIVTSLLFFLLLKSMQIVMNIHVHLIHFWFQQKWKENVNIKVDFSFENTSRCELQLFTHA